MEKAKTPTLNRTQLARRYGVSLPTIDSWVRRGCPHRRRSDGRYAFQILEVARWRARQLAEDSQRRGHMNGRRPIPDGAREWLDAITIPFDYMLPWLVDPQRAKADAAKSDASSMIVTLEQYRDESGADGDELFYRVLYGLPTLPPAPGDKKKRGRISLPHARAWLLIFSGFVESIGGDGMAKRIACEARRIHGFPVPNPGSEPIDETGEEVSL